MKGEHCIAGASLLTLMAMILLVFANIGQLHAGAVCSGVYMVEVNVMGLGNAIQSANKLSAGLYDTVNDKKKDPLGGSKGLRQYYRWGLYNGCGYQKNGAGICNDTAFAYPFAPLEQIVADAPAKPNDYKKIITQIIPDEAASFKDDGWNRGLSRTGSMLIFIGSILTIPALVAGVVKARVSFLVAAVSSGVSALLLMIGAAMWSSIIAKDSWLKVVKVQGKVPLGITVKAGASLGLTWAACVFMALATAPYAISCFTFRRARPKDSYNQF